MHELYEALPWFSTYAYIHLNSFEHVVVVNSGSGGGSISGSGGGSSGSGSSGSIST
jgi:hypothetical protein